jgi:carbon storage regulator
MLVLSRKKGESITIGDNVTLTVVEIRGDKVRLGIDAPRDVAVHRDEVARAIADALLKDESSPAESATAAQSTC